MRHAFRLFYTGWLFHVKSLTLSGFFILTTAVLPVFYASIAYFMSGPARGRDRSSTSRSAPG